MNTAKFSIYFLIFFLFCLPSTASVYGYQGMPTSEVKAIERPSTLSLQAEATGENASRSPGTMIAAATKSPQAKSFYEGKIITLVVASAAGGGFDAYSRLLARFMPRYIPGNPKIVVQNRAGSKLVTANYIFTIAKPDGLTFSMSSTGLYNSELAGEKGVEYKFSQFNWIGSMDSKAQTFMVRADTGVKTIKDLQNYKGPVLRNGFPGKEAGAYTASRLMEDILGIKFKYVFGFGGTGPRALAIEQNVIDCMLDPVDTVLNTRPEWMKSGYINIVLQTGPKRHPALKDIPALGEFAATQEDKAMVQLADAGQTMGRPLQAPPGVPKDRVEILRQAFAKAMQDPDLLATAKRSGYEIEPMTGEEVQKLTRDIMAVDPVLKSRYLRLFE